MDSQWKTIEKTGCISRYHSVCNPILWAMAISKILFRGDCESNTKWSWILEMQARVWEKSIKKNWFYSQRIHSIVSMNEHSAATSIIPSIATTRTDFTGPNLWLDFSWYWTGRWYNLNSDLVVTYSIPASVLRVGGWNGDGAVIKIGAAKLLTPKKACHVRPEALCTGSVTAKWNQKEKTTELAAAHS